MNKMKNGNKLHLFGFGEYASSIKLSLVEKNSKKKFFLFDVA